MTVWLTVSESAGVKKEEPRRWCVGVLLSAVGARDGGLLQGIPKRAS